jgi:poly-gamma-glutamate capsule biosynthesis protein CapA/YwtB (metallophosphatase superfamily)
MVNAAVHAPIYAVQTPSSSVRDLAAAGHFRAIALWLNEPLAAQGIYVQVQAEQPGRLMLLVEFEQPPIKERLTRFLCHRVWLLNSPLIEGIHIVARPAGRRRVVWQQRIRIVTPALKGRKSVERPIAPVAGASPLPPRLRSHPPTPSPATRLPALLLGSQLKTLRALVLTGTAVAAFVFGCLVEVILSGPSPDLPSFAQRHEVRETADGGRGFTAAPQARTADAPAATPVRYEVRGNATPAAPPELRSPIVDAALEPVAVIQHPPISPAAPDVTLLFGGDISLDEISYNEAGEAEQLFAGLEAYQQADLAMVNLASPLATAATSLNEEFHQRSRPDAIELLKQGGVDLVNLASEGTMNFGGEGLAETLENLDRQGLYRVGAGRNELEARRPEIIDVKGKRIAYLSYAQGGDSAAHGDRPGINAQGLQGIAQDIRALRDQVDWIVVNYRWQTDIPEVPADWQTNLARLAVDQGADLVVGYHPTTLQGAEIYKGRPIAYSLGDFIFQRPTAAADGETGGTRDQDTAVLKVALKENQMRVEFVPVQVRNARPEMATGRKGKEILSRIEESSAGFDWPMRSSAVLELKGKDPIVDQPVSPDSPFVSPEPAPFVPLEPSVDEGWKEQQPSEALPAETDLAPVPESFDQETLDQDLDGWGPKHSPSEPEFMPIPSMPSEARPDSTLQPPSDFPEGAESETWESPAGFPREAEADAWQSPAGFPGEAEADTWQSPGGFPGEAEADAWPSSDIHSEYSTEGAEEIAPVEAVPTINGPALTPDTSPRRGIRPFGEPLVGPLGSTTKQPKAVAATPAGLDPASPQSTPKPTGETSAATGTAAENSSHQAQP